MPQLNSATENEGALVITAFSGTPTPLAVRSAYSATAVHRWMALPQYRGASLDAKQRTQAEGMKAGSLLSRLQA